ncbi:MAG: dynamin family protein [Akkermansia sp.]|nr:dynamin family protein [Akkermansia sp.]
METPLDIICKESSAYAAKLDFIPQASPELRTLTTRSAREIRRSLARFDSKLLLMATIGSVKSGKSTLTNCLTHRNLCATKLGIETTRLPMVILASDDGTERMELFSPLAADTLSEQELFELVIDYLRHVAPPEFEEKVSIERRNISQANLDAWAMGHTSASCAAIFLVEPAARLLGAGIGIVDMPGMDGLTSNWHDEKLHDWMNENADYFLLVQSSFAALTPDTRDYLRAAMERSHRPIRVVQNRIEAQFWLGSAEQEEQQERQQLNTQKQLSDFIRKVIPGSWVNAGLAWWQQENKFRSKDTPTPPNTPGSKSNLSILEDEILADLHNPEVTLRRNSADYLLKTLENLDTRLKQFTKSSQDHISHIHRIQADIHKLMDSARVREAIESNNMKDGRIRCKYLADQARQTLYTRLDAILDLAVDGYFPADWMANDMMAQELNRIRSKVENDLGDLAAEQETHVLAPSKICELTELEKEKIESCARILGRRQAEDIEKDYTKAIINAWEHVPLDCTPIRLGELKETTFMGMINRTCSYNQTSPEWRRAGREAIASRLEQWSRRVSEALDMFVSRRVKALEECLRHELKSFEDAEQTGRSIHAAEKDIEVISGLRSALAPTLLKARQLKATHTIN